MSEFDCLYGLVGVKAGGETESESGLYVTSLPDITLSEISKIAKSTEAEDEDTIAKVWEDVQKRGILKFRTLFISELNKCWKVSKIDVAECLICENSVLLSTALWYLLGAELMFERINSSRINRFTTIDKAKAKELRSELMELFHNELSVAIAGIDIYSSECFEHEDPESKNIVTFHESLP